MGVCDVLYYIYNVIILYTVTPVSATHIHKQLKLVFDQQHTAADNGRGHCRAVVLYSELFFKALRNIQRDAGKIILGL